MNKILNKEELSAIISKGSSNVISIEDILKKIETKKILKIKLGADPTAPNLHLGHAVVLEKLRDLQNIGHQVIFLIGDFTARIGDPTGKSKTRPPLSEDKILENTKTYISQIGRILDLSKTTIRYNSEWLDKLTSRDWIRLCASTTLARIIEREDFWKRFSEKTPIGMHELLYPLIQGYDSVALEADIELGGTDQTFNLLMGRFLQEQMGQDPQAIITMPLLEGLDGINKMSKSLGNDIGLTEEPNNVFGKIMSISDDIMYRYYEVLLRNTEKEINLLKNNHPIENKKNLAKRIIEKYWSKDEAEKAYLFFEKTFQKKDYADAPKIKLENNEYKIIDLMIIIDSSLSKTECRRLISSGAVYINDNKIENENFIFLKKNENFIKIGKKRIFNLI